MTKVHQSRNGPDEELQGQAVHVKNWRIQVWCSAGAEAWFIAKEVIRKINKKIHIHIYKYVDSWSLPQKSNISHNAEDDTRICCTWFLTMSPVFNCIKNRNWRWFILSVFLWRLWEDKGHVDLPSQSTAFRPLQCGFSGERHYLHELRKQVQNLQIKSRRNNFTMIFEKLKWLILIWHNWIESIQRHHRKIKRLWRPVSPRRMPRETEKPPRTMIDEKPTNGTSTSKNDQDGHGMMKSDNL